MPNPMPGRLVPALTLPSLAGPDFDVHHTPIDRLLMLVVYRGVHCSACKNYLQTLDRLVTEYANAGIRTQAVSVNDQAQAKQAQHDWELNHLPIAHSLTEEDMRAWGLYVSSPIRDGEPPLFSEPGLFFIKPDRTLYYAALNTMPFGRPDLQDMLEKITDVLGRDYPPRGEA